ncbi:hypothetical protein B0H13DRAFT_905467 [Mycena leptocephala]|nr:hypothetical protein B0H13DRAFT_905467 [Mycena leptocephala]
MKDIRRQTLLACPSRGPPRRHGVPHQYSATRAAPDPNARPQCCVLRHGSIIPRAERPVRASSFPKRQRPPGQRALPRRLGAPPDDPAAAVTIHPRNQAGLAAYAQQITAYAQKHGTLKPSEERPYPLTPGTVAVGSGECHKCGRWDTSVLNAPLPATSSSPTSRYAGARSSSPSAPAPHAPQTLAVNIVADASEDVFGTAEYDHAVIEEYLRTQGKAEGPST